MQPSIGLYKITGNRGHTLNKLIKCTYVIYSSHLHLVVLRRNTERNISMWSPWSCSGRRVGEFPNN